MLIFFSTLGLSGSPQAVRYIYLYFKPMQKPSLIILGKFKNFRIGFWLDFMWYCNFKDRGGGSMRVKEWDLGFSPERMEVFYKWKGRGSWSVIVYCGVWTSNWHHVHGFIYMLQPFQDCFPSSQQLLSLCCKKITALFMCHFFPYYYETTNLYESAVVLYQSTMTVSGMRWNLRKGNSFLLTHFCGHNGPNCVCVFIIF